MTTKLALNVLASALLLACSSEASDPGGSPTTDGADAAVAARPGASDSSKVFKGTPSEAEAAFWVAVRDGNDAARDAAVSALKADVAREPTNGYSAFLIGSAAFMPSSNLLRALAAGQPVAGGPPSFPPDTVAYLEQGARNLTDPLYLGFDYTLLAALQSQSAPAEAAKTLGLAIANNVPASAIGIVNNQLGGGDTKGALDTLLGMFKYCDGGALDVEAPDLDGFADAANRGALVHRECYSGYRARHATEGELLLAGDLYAVDGKPELATKAYAAMTRASGYATWELRPLAERRIAGTQPATAPELPLIVACTTCHVNELR